MPDDKNLPTGPADEPTEPTEPSPRAQVPSPSPVPSSDGGDDVAFARLRAADPAAGAEPDASRLRAAVAAAVGDDPRTDGPAGAHEETVDVVPVPDELAAARGRRSGRRWLPVAAAVAGIAIVGSGGFAAGVAAQGDGSGAASTADLAAPPMTLEQPTEARDESAAGASDMAASSKLAWFGGRVVFTAGSGLSDDGTTGTAYALDAASVFSRDTLARVAAALGVSGEPRLEYGSWSAGATDGTGPTVSLSPDGSASVSYYDPSRDPWSCVASAPETLDKAPDEPAASDGAGTTGSTGAADAAEPALIDPGFGADCANRDLPPAPTGDAARAKAADVLRSLGVDPAGYELDVAQDPGSPALAQVTASQVVDGQRTGVVWSVALVGDAVQSVWGSLAPVVELGDYRVVSPRAAVERLADPRFGSSGGGMPFAVADEVRAAESGAAVAPAPEAEPTVPATPTSGPLAWPVEDVTIESARLGLAFTTLPDGAAVLVPTYELSSADGRTWTVVAVADEDLDFTTTR